MMKTIQGNVTLEGLIDGVLFESPTSLFKIISVKITKKNFDWDDATIIVTGSFGELSLDERYEFSGQVVSHPKYGRQFQTDNYHLMSPDTESSLVAYFSGTQFKGVGKATAQKIIDHLGLDAIDKILANADVLQEVGLKPAQQQAVVAQLAQSHGTEQAMITLAEYGFGPRLVDQIISKYHSDALAVIQKNPYQLVYDIQGIGFKRADQVAAKLGIAADAQVRIEAALIQFLRNDLATNGNTYSDPRAVLEGALALLSDSRFEVPSDQQVADELVALAASGGIIVEEKRIYLHSSYQSEFEITNRLQKLLTAKEKSWSVKSFDQELKALSRWLKVVYDQQQVDAIKMALDQPISILTGGPGTGKTTILSAVVTLFAKKNHLSLDPKDYEDEPFPIRLAAPTGRAAKRLSETIGLPAQTIHRLLGLTAMDDQPFQEQAQEIQGRLLIIDEMSMVDQQLFQTLLQAVPEGMQVVLVGDQDQLPSVGPGRVFADLIASHCVPTTKLTKIYRQSTGSTIISLARDINQGMIPDNLTDNLPDRSFIACLPGQVEHIVEQVIQKSIARGFSLEETQILAPMYRGVAGIDAMNNGVQNLVNPKKAAATKEIKFGQVTYRIGDKVIQLQNDGQRGIYNGDIGRVTGIEEASKKNDHQAKLIVDFSGNEVELVAADWRNLSLAYCVSIHKSQGSEYELVILPLTMQSHRMLQRKLLYTAITRARAKLVMVGQKEAFVQAILAEGTERRTTLAQRIRRLMNPDEVNDAPKTADTQVDHKKETASQAQTEDRNSDLAATVEDPQTFRLTATLIASGKIDPMIGMENIKLTTKTSA